MVAGAESRCEKPEAVWEIESEWLLLFPNKEPFALNHHFEDLRPYIMDRITTSAPLLYLYITVLQLLHSVKRLSPTDGLI